MREYARDFLPVAFAGISSALAAIFMPIHSMLAMISLQEYANAVEAVAMTLGAFISAVTLIALLRKLYKSW